MARTKTEIKTFNRGLISPLALARTDLERTSLSAETMTNWMPRNLGSMMLRPGTEYIGNTASDNAAKLIPFIFSTTDTALLEITDSLVRVWVDDALVTRPSVSTTVTGGDFTGSIDAAWVDNDEGTAASAYGSDDGLEFLTLLGTGTDAAIRTQEVTVAVGDQGTEHALEIKIGEAIPGVSAFNAGSPATIRVGSTEGDDDYINETRLGEGYHSLSFTPTGNFWIELSNRAISYAWVDYCKVESSGTLTLPSPWAAADLGNLTWDQSADVLYVACSKTADSTGYPPFKIERRSTTGWSVVKYEPQDGPFQDINTTTTTLTANALTGLVTLTASTPLFRGGTTVEQGMLMRVTSQGQTVTVSNIASEDTWTDPIEVTGVTSARIFTVTIADRTDSTVTLQRSLTADDGPWEDVNTYTANSTFTYDDSLDNQVAWYRIGVNTGDYGTDAIDLTLDYPLGSITGIGRIYATPSSTTVTVNTLKAFGSLSASADWYFGEWSDRFNYPTSVALVEGRLGWAGRNKVWLSESDGYENFDDETIGDSGPIARTIGQGPVDNVNFMVSVNRLIYGTDSAEWNLRSSSEDEPLTPSNANPKTFSTQGSAAVNAVKLDNTALFVQRGGTRLYEATPSSDVADFGNYGSNDLTVLYPEAGDSPFTRIALQRQPDTRIHCVRTDGAVSILLHETAENVSCWVKLTPSGTDAMVEDVAVLPGADGSQEDAVYYIVSRTVNSSTVRFLEKWSLESDNQGGTNNKQMDAGVTGTVASGVMSGLSHLEGESVVAWVNGKDAGSGTVSGGSVTGLTEDGSGTVGLSYTAQFKSTKLGELVEKKNIARLGFIMHNTHYQGVKYGPTFSDLDDLPQVRDGATTAADTVIAGYDEEMFSFDGRWNSDSRLCLQATSPRPCTLLAAIVEMED